MRETNHACLDEMKIDQHHEENQHTNHEENQQTNQDREPPPCKKRLRPSHLSLIPGQAVASWQRVLLLPFFPSAIIIIIVNIVNIIMLLPLPPLAIKSAYF